MVFFSCTGCGDTFKKAAVAKHKSHCRRSYVIACLDCSVNYEGDEYISHVKCVSEKQKYSGGTFQDKTSKNELKQQNWFENVQRAIDNTQVSDFKLRSLLERIKAYENIPRKAAKFKNFLKSSLGVRNESLAENAWLAISSAKGAEDKSNGGEPNSIDKEEPQQTDEIVDETLVSAAAAEKPKPDEELTNISEAAELSVNGNKSELNGAQVISLTPKQKKRKCRQAIKRILAQAPEKTMSMKKIRKATLPELAVMNIGKADLLSYMETMSASKRFAINEKYVTLLK